MDTHEANVELVRTTVDLFNANDLDLGSIIRPGDQVVWAQGAGDPVSLSCSRYSAIVGALSGMRSSRGGQPAQVTSRPLGGPAARLGLLGAGGACASARLGGRRSCRYALNAPEGRSVRTDLAARVIFMLSRHLNGRVEGHPDTAHPDGGAGVAVQRERRAGCP